MSNDRPGACSLEKDVVQLRFRGLSVEVSTEEPVVEVYRFAFLTSPHRLRVHDFVFNSPMLDIVFKNLVRFMPFLSSSGNFRRPGAAVDFERNLLLVYSQVCLFQTKRRYLEGEFETIFLLFLIQNYTK